MAEAAILDLGKIAMTLSMIEGFGSNFVCRYKKTHEIRSRDRKIHLTKLLGCGHHLGFGKTAITSPRMAVFH